MAVALAEASVCLKGIHHVFRNSKLASHALEIAVPMEYLQARIWHKACAATMSNVYTRMERFMPSLSTILKGEITRLARKEIKAAIDPVRKANAGHRKEIAELKRQVASLQRDLKAASKPSTARVEADEASTRFSAKGLKSLRAKLGLSAAEFGQLVGASGQSIYNWETGKAVPRASQQAALAAVRGIGKREAGKRLAEIG